MTDNNLDEGTLEANRTDQHPARKEAGVHSEPEIYPGKPHAWFNSEPDRTVTTGRMERFLVERFGLRG